MFEPCMTAFAGIDATQPVERPDTKVTRARRDSVLAEIKQQQREGKLINAQYACVSAGLSYTQTNWVLDRV